MKTRPILAGTDFSIPSRAAVARAAQLSRAIGAPLQLLHVMDERSTATRRTPLPTGFRTSFSSGPPAERGGGFARIGIAEAQLTELEKKARPQRTLRRYGRAYDQFIRAVRSTGARLAVVGVHQPKSASERFLLGTTAERVLRSASRPVLIVRRRSVRPYANVLVPIDFSKATPHQFGALREFVPGAKFTVLHILPSDTVRNMAGESKLRYDVLRLAAKAGIPKSSLVFAVDTGDPRRAILRCESESRPDLIVIGTHGRGGLARLLLGSVAEHVIRGTATDVLAVPSPL
jgi:nucleotide-binding universal stress UspA family protein